MTRSILTTGARLVEDVKKLFCQSCGGAGLLITSRFHLETGEWERVGKIPCPDCDGFGY